MTLRVKIVGILLAPFLGLVAFASWNVWSQWTSWRGAQAARVQMLQAVGTSELVHQLQLERGLSGGFLSSKGQKYRVELPAQRDKSDAAGAASVEGLAALRAQIDGLSVPGTTSFARYTESIGSLLNTVAQVGTQAIDPQLVRLALAYFAFLNIKEHAGQERATLNEVLSVGRFSEETYRRLLTVLSAQDEHRLTFEVLAGPQAVQRSQELWNSPVSRQVTAMEASVLAASREGPFSVTAEDWFATITGKINAMKSVEDSLAGELISTSEALASGAFSALVGAGLGFAVSLLISLLLAARLLADVRRQLGCEPAEVAAIARSISRGQLDVVRRTGRATGAYQDLMAMVDALQTKADVLKTIAGGDLTAEVPLASEADSLGLSLRQMTDSLNRVLGEINTAVDQLSSGSSQVATASQTLASGATEQASSLEEVNATASVVTGQARANARTAQESRTEAEKSREAAQDGRAHMQALVEMLETMTRASEQTKSIVKTIDDIAFQVNLLALNANVEAARAGRYGKGFSVVAGEVRSLAVRSAGAVKETTAMVDQNLRAIGQVNDTAQKTYGALAAIADASTRVATILDEIAASSQEQARGLSQIGVGLDQIDQVTQANTASAEQSAAAAEQLAGQAQQLRQQVAQFRLKPR